MTSTIKTHSIASYDNAPYLDKVLRYAVQHNLIDRVRADEIINDAATGTIQIAEYFGESEHLRKNLEVSMKRMVGLVSLFLEEAADGDLHRAALLIKEKPFRSLSRGGSQMLKTLFTLPEDDHLNSPRLDSEREFLKKCLTNGMSVTKYRQSLKACEGFKREIDFAGWLVRKIGGSTNQLNELHASAEHVVRTALLLLAYGTKKVGGTKSNFPDELGLFEIFVAIRKEWGFLGDVTYSSKFIEEIPAQFQDYAKEVLISIQNEDIPKIVNQSIQIESIFNDLKDRKYFYLHDYLKGVSQFDKMHAKEWYALTGEMDDDASLQTLFVCAASGTPLKTTLKVSEAKNAVLSIRKNGILHNEVLKLIEKSPHDEIMQLKSLWLDFIEEATPFLLDGSDEKLKEVMVYLFDHCNIQKPEKIK